MNIFKYLLIICLLTSCQKQSPPVVTIVSPLNGQLFQIGDTVKIQAQLSDADILLNEYLTVVTGKNYVDTIIKFVGNTENPSYTLSKQFPIQTNDTVKIIVAAWGGSSILVEKTVFVRAQ